MLLLGFISTSLMASLGFAGAIQAYYEEVSSSDGSAESMQQIYGINKVFHKCSMNETCNYVIKNVVNGTTTFFNNEDEFPQNLTYFRIWKKIYHGPLKDCRDAYNRGNKKDGVFTIKIPVLGLRQVRCDMTTLPGGWTVFQRRIDGSVSFNRNWLEYKEGFGHLKGNFWLGLEKLHQLAPPGKGAKLRVDLKHMDLPGESRYAEYSTFEISGEADDYKLTIGGYSGTVGDSLKYHNSMKFTTKDRDSDLSSVKNCASHNQGAFWHKSCYTAHLNGIYPPSSVFQISDGAQNVAILLENFVHFGENFLQGIMVYDGSDRPRKKLILL